MRLNRSVAAVMTLALASCSETTPTAPTPVAPATGPAAIRISGRLVDYQSGQSVGGTTIAWHPMVPNVATPTLSVTADTSGHFEIELPAADTLGTFGFQIQTGPINFQSGVVRVPGKRLQTELLVNGGPCAARYGFVFDAVTRQPIAGARVVRAGSGVTDANGYYRIDIGCEPRDSFYWGIGTTTISVQHPSYEGTFMLDGRRESTSYSGIRRVDFVMQPLSQ